MQSFFTGPSSSLLLGLDCASRIKLGIDLCYMCMLLGWSHFLSWEIVLPITCIHELSSQCRNNMGMTKDKEALLL